jgi:hypothetical protein
LIGQICRGTKNFGFFPDIETFTGISDFLFWQNARFALKGRPLGAVEIE